MGVEYPDVARVTVPLLVGMTVREARRAGHNSGVVVTSADMDGPPLGALTWPGTWTVIAQRPVAGSRVERGSAVVIEFEERPGGGGAGDREPRVP
jgi:beta-lactam-binding protein with PASTA domain